MSRNRKSEIVSLYPRNACIAEPQEARVRRLVKCHEREEGREILMANYTE